MSAIKKLLSVFQNIHFQSLLGNGVMAVFGMVTVAILYRALSIIEVGVYVLFMTIFGLVDNLKGGFLTNPYIKFYSGSGEGRSREVAGSAWVLVLMVTLGVVMVNIPAYFLIPHIKSFGVVLFVKFFAITFLSTVPSFMANLAVQSEKRFDQLLWLRLINQILFTGTVVVLIIIKKSSLTNIILAYIVANIVTSIVMLVLGWTKLRYIRYATKATVIEIANFGKYSMGTSLSSNLFGFTDTMMITIFLGPAGLALYNLGVKLNQIVEIPMLSFAASGFPLLSAFYNNNQPEEMIHTMKKLIGMLSIAIAAIAIVAVIFAEPIIGLVGGAKYIHTEAPNLFRIFISITIFYPADRFLALTLDVIHKPKINFYKILVMLVVNLVADYVAVSIFKTVYAIALTNVFPVLVAIVIAYVPLNKFHKFNFWNIYVVGYKETILFVKETYSSLIT